MLRFEDDDSYRGPLAQVLPICLPAIRSQPSMKLDPNVAVESPVIIDYAGLLRMRAR